MNKKQRKEKAIESIVDYIKKETENGKSIVLKSVDVSSILNIPQSTCIRLLREVRGNKNIKSEPIYPEKKKGTPFKFIHIDNIKDVKEEPKENLEENPTDVLCKNLNMFAEHMSNFQSFIAETTDFIKNGESSKLLKNDLEQSKNVIENFIAENIELQNNIHRLKEDKKEAWAYINGLKEMNNNVISYMQNRLQIVIAEMTNASKEYVETPKWQINNSFDSKFQKKILDIITIAIDDILNNNTNIKEQ